MLTKELEDAFYEVVTAVIDDFNAITFSLQEWALKRAITIWEWWYFDQAEIDIVAAEMRPAAIDVFKRFLDPTGRRGPLVEDKAVKLAEENFHGETHYEQCDLEVGGLGNFPIDAEAFRRALPALASIQKLMANNERSSASALKIYKLLQTLNEQKKSHG